MKAVSILAATALAGLAAPAAALPIPGTDLNVSGEANLVSDYRFRGLSRSGGDPALTGQLTVAHGSGFYVGSRGATLDGVDPFRLRDQRFEDLGSVQLDLYAGYNKELGLGLSADGGVIYYLFPSGDGATDYFEPYGSLSYLLGPVEATVGAHYAPAQRAIGDEAMLYTFGELQAGIPLTGIGFTAHAGRQDWGRYGSYWNWSVGGRYVLGPAQIGLRYVDTGLPATLPITGAGSAPAVSGQKAGIVLSLGVRF